MLSIITGRFRGKKLKHPPDSITRPTSNRTREAVFNCLFSLDISIQDACFLDGFAGSGAVGLEAISRGARFCSFVENNPKAASILKENIMSCKLVPNEYEIKTRFKSFEHPFDIIYLDPPYGHLEDGNPIYKSVLNSLQKDNLIAPESVVIIETAAKENLHIPKFMEVALEKTYGAAKVSFLRICSL